ncbi:MAG TPA: phospholipase D-like domain-containing protein, partial [Planctomycetota bacterium]|nr:phospholipase D-like domain-containing protein [Planctomycetota bacterium]
YLTDRILGGTMPWLDVMAQVTGPVVGRLHRAFVEDWCHATEEDLSEARYFPRVPPAGQDRVGVVDTGPDAPSNRLGLVLLQLIAAARQRLDICTPYLIPSPTVLAALELAVRRGVRVRLHTNGRPVENWLLYRAQRSYYAELLAAGVELWESRHAYNHSKMILVDRRYLGIGSPNLDRRSAELNFEIAIVATRSRAMRDASDLFERRLRTAERVTAAPSRSLLDGLCRLASPLL